MTGRCQIFIAVLVCSVYVNRTIYDNELSVMTSRMQLSQREAKIVENKFWEYMFIFPLHLNMSMEIDMIFLEIFLAIYICMYNRYLCMYTVYKNITFRGTWVAQSVK